MGGRVATETSHSRERPIPINTPARTPNTSVPAIAAVAIQKSKRCTLASRRISGRSIMPMTTASMIKAANTGLGSFENSGANTRRVSSTMTPEVNEARPVRAPEWSLRELAERLVDTGMPWNRPAPDVGHSLGYRFLVDVDAIAVLGRERPGVASGLGEPDEHQRHRRHGDHAGVIAHQLPLGELHARQPPWHLTHQGDPMPAQVEDP